MNPLPEPGSSVSAALNVVPNLVEVGEVPKGLSQP